METGELQIVLKLFKTFSFISNSQEEFWYD